jgi:hypothetical protein
MKTLQEQLQCAQRELAVRKKVYPKWVTDGRMSQHAAEHELDCMQSIVDTIRKYVHLHEISEQMREDDAKNLRTKSGTGLARTQLGRNQDPVPVAGTRGEQDSRTPENSNVR